MKLAIAAALALAAAVVPEANAQTPQARIEGAMARAKTAGIPVALLENKVAEGRAKGVSLDRIAAAVERRAAALEHASQVLRGPRQVDTAGLGVAADAVEAGISDAALAAVADSAPRERRAVAIAVLTELVSRGRSQENALEQVRDALEKGPAALANLPAQAGAAQGQPGGRPPDNPSTNRPDDAGSRGRGRGTAAPPAAVPAPGGSTQPTRPGGPPASPGPPESPGRGRGRGRG